MPFGAMVKILMNMINWVTGVQLACATFFLEVIEMMTAN